MARARVPTIPAREPLLSANPTAALTRLRRRLDEVEKLKDIDDPDDGRFERAEINIRDDIREIFGENSSEFQHHQGHDIYKSNEAFLLSRSEYEIKVIRQQGRRQGIAATKTMLEGLIERVHERASESAIDGVRDARAVFGQLLLHPRILDASHKQFVDRHYRDAILAAGIALTEYVKERSGSIQDGTALMQSVFSVNKPVLAFNELKNQSDKDEQQGMMSLFVGAVQALRNPRAHSLDPDTADYALEAISFISFLAKQLDSARKVSS